MTSATKPDRPPEDVKIIRKVVRAGGLKSPKVKPGTIVTLDRSRTPDYDIGKSYTSAKILRDCSDILSHIDESHLVNIENTWINPSQGISKTTLALAVPHRQEPAMNCWYNPLLVSSALEKAWNAMDDKPFAISVIPWETGDPANPSCEGMLILFNDLTFRANDPVLQNNKALKQLVNSHKSIFQDSIPYMERTLAAACNRIGSNRQILDRITPPHGSRGVH
jgi:hypothetical protein